MKCNFKGWLKCAAVRAVKTVAQSAFAAIGTLSLLTSIAGLPEIKDGGNEHEVLTYRQSRGGHPLIEEIL